MQDRALDAARLNEAEACARAQLATRELDRQRRLLANGVTSQQDVDLAETQHTTATASCAAARALTGQGVAAVTLAEVMLRKTVLRAPFDAVVSKVSTHLGEWITPSPAGLPMPTAVELIDPASIYIVAPLDEVDSGKVRAGLPARITLDAYPGRSYAGGVTRVGTYVSEAQQQNRTFDVDVQLDDRKFAQTLLPGTSADVEIVLQVREQVLRIPTAAILQGGRVLMVRDGVLVGVPITTGLTNWQFSEVTQGLRAGEAVVTSLDRAEVREGARVRIEPEVVK
jgi:HlyD family secretion protein